MSPTTTALALLGCLASAKPLMYRANSPTFNLAYQWNGTTDVPGTLAALKTGTWYIGNKDNEAVLFPVRDQAALFYEYGNSPSIATASTGITIVPGGTATISSGQPVHLSSNQATSNVSITKDALLQHEQDGSFQACIYQESDELYLSYVEPGQRFLAACAPVTIEARCSAGGIGKEHVGSLGGPVGVQCRTAFIGGK